MTTEPVHGQTADDSAEADYIVAIRSQLDRLRVEQMLNRSIRGARIRSGDHPATATADLPPGSDTVLIVLLREIDAETQECLPSIAALGVKILVLVDDARSASWHRLAGIPLGGCLSTGELSEHVLRSAIDRVRAGELPISANLVHALLSRADATPPSPPRTPGIQMTLREQQTLMLLVHGLSNKQIARRLGISVHGAKRLVANVLAKLGCENRTSAVSRALREGLYDRYRRPLDHAGTVP